MKFISASDAARLVPSDAHVLVSGSGGGHGVPEAVLEAIEARFLGEGAPRDLTLIHVVGIGDRQQKGAARFRHDGLLRRSITSALVDSPALIELALADKIESYILPQGVMSQLMREIAGGRPGLITRTGLHTFIDPRHGGGRQNASAKDELIELITIDGQEWLRFKPLRFDVAILRGTTADEDGNISMEQEAIPGEMLSMAQATRRQRRHRHRAGQARGAARHAAAARGEDPRHPRRLRGGRSGAAADLRDRLQPELCGRVARAARRREAAALRPAQDRGAPRRHGVRAERDLQSRRRHLDRHRGGRRRGEHHRPRSCSPTSRASSAARR